MTKITPYELWLDFKSWVNTQQGGFMPPQSIFIRVANTASLRLFNNLTGEAEKTQEIKDMLFPFLKSKNVICDGGSNIYGSVTPPLDYARFASCKILYVDTNSQDSKITLPSKSVDRGKCVCNGKDKLVQYKTDQDLSDEYYKSVRESNVQMIDNQRWASCLEHLTKSPTFEKPKMTQIDNVFKVAPKGVGVVVLNYYVEPIDAVFGYTPIPGNIQTGSGGGIVYDPSKSKNFQWTKIAKIHLLEMVKQVYIEYTRDGLFHQINAQSKQIT